ncbi:PE family protein [Mycobacterium uberis]|uniref:PE family protein n=1 Tax=Mycobacterium uberis TaxID=2162698 RepID=A0A3E1HDL0_9MYCO|nr:PE family protein [Mycobacterium uberis]RFD24533.1 PE family protein [Mycobacterium uberis]
MSFFLDVEPQAIQLAASQLQVLGSSTVASNVAAASVTTLIPPPAADDVSALLAQFFNAHGQQYQAHATRGTAIYQRLVETLAEAGERYENVEFSNGEMFN